MEKINWCFKVNGLKIIEPNLIVSKSYLEQSEKALSKVKSLIDENDFVWANSRIYYCAYYALLSFLYKIGIKSENHDCSIELIKFLFGKDFGISSYKENRIKSQYYFKFSSKEELLNDYSKIKLFFVNFKKIIDLIKDKEIEEYRNKVKEMINE